MCYRDPSSLKLLWMTITRNKLNYNLWKSVTSCWGLCPKKSVVKPKKNLGNACRFKKKSYLCIAFEKEHFWKEVLERWQSGRSRRSWKPLYWEVPGVRIPLSPLKQKTSKRLKFIWRILFVFFLLQGGSRQRRDGLDNPYLSARKRIRKKLRILFFV